uniref:LPS-assembly protein LptD n=1 Tax=Nitrospira cf. moscoviensis SBR1015 TaxID=96242 RepID=UPI00117FE6C9
MAVICLRFAANMGDPLAWIRQGARLFVFTVLLSPLPLSAADQQGGSAPASSASAPLDITAERIDYQPEQEIYEANGAVVIRQGGITLTADHATIQALPGILTAVGHVHLTDVQADVTAERLELNINTEAGVATHAQLFVPSRNALVDGRHLQRLSEYHYRVKDGSFTNCDAQEGEVPAWRFRFKDVDMTVGDTLAFKGGWFCILDVPTIPLPTFSYPMARRQTGFLIPTPKYNSRFGFGAQAHFFWAISP